MGGFIDLQAFPGPKIDLPNPEWETMKDLVVFGLRLTKSFSQARGFFLPGRGPAARILFLLLGNAWKGPGLHFAFLLFAG